MLVESLMNTIKRQEVFDESLAKDRRDRFLIKKLSSTEKMELYDSGVKGDLKKLKEVVEKKKYNLLEECSAAGYYWTSLHYACHYGHMNIIEYYIDYFKYSPNKLEIFNIQSNLGMTPLMISIVNVPNIDDRKKQILKLFVLNDIVDYKLCNNKGEDLFAICKKNSLLDYLFSLLKED